MYAEHGWEEIFVFIFLFYDSHLGFSDFSPNVHIYLLVNKIQVIISTLLYIGVGYDQTSLVNEKYPLRFVSFVNVLDFFDKK